MSKRLLPLIPAGLVVDQVHHGPERLTILTRPRAALASCPACGQPSARLHSRYTRTLADLSWQGRRVTIVVRSRRWRCTGSGCSRRIFTERLPGTAVPRGRRTQRLGDLQRYLGLALGGEAGTRLAERLSIPTSPDTLLRLVRRGAPADPAQAPRVLGVDDWAWRRGQRYGTILCDLEQGRIVDLLPDREAATLSGWLRSHSGVEVVARDRAGAYADGVRRGAPGAVQVADRWHLLCNGSEALLQVLERHRGAFARVARDVVSEVAAEIPPPEPRPPTKAQRRQRQGQDERDARFRHVATLAHDGQGIRAIVRATGLARNTVRRWLRTGAAPTWRKGERARITDPFLPYLVQRVSGGERNATQLWREIRACGFAGQVMTVRTRVATLRGDGPARGRSAPTPVWRRPSPRRTVRLLLSAGERVGLDGRFLSALVAAVPEIGRAVDEVRAFATLVRGRDREAFGPWLERCRGGPLRGLVEGLLRDRAAVEAALVLPWSTSPVEGQISRLKLLKRTMYGRAKLDLLRARVLAA